MAARAPKPDTVPSVENFAVSGREEQDARDWRFIGPEARLITVQNPTAAHDPGGMLATTAQGPPARDAVAAIDDHSTPEGPKRPSRSDVRVAAVDFARCVHRQVSAEYAILAANRHTPARCAIGPSDLFDDANEGHRIGFFASKRTWNPEAK